MYSKFAGLPAHPLFVHVPIVLLPLVAIGAIAMAMSGWVRDRLGWLLLALMIVAGLSTQFAVESGQALQDSVARSSALDRHIAIGESIRPLALALFLVALAVMLLDRRALGRWPFAGRANGPGAATATPPVRPWIRIGLVVLTIAIAIVTSGRLYQIGHTGAEATWQNTKVSPTGGE